MIANIKHQHFGIYAFILNSQKTHVLLIQKSRGPYNEMFDLPGGSPEKGETIKETLVREVTEETGAEVLEAQDMGAFEIQFEYQKNEKKYELTHTGHIFITKLKSKILMGIESSDSSGCLWVERSKAAAFQVTPPVMQALKMYKAYQQDNL